MLRTKTAVRTASALFVHRHQQNTEDRHNAGVPNFDDLRQQNRTVQTRPPLWRIKCKH